MHDRLQQAIAVWQPALLDADLRRLDKVLSGETVEEECHTPLSVEEWRAKIGPAVGDS